MMVLLAILITGLITASIAHAETKTVENLKTVERLKIVRTTIQPEEWGTKYNIRFYNEGDELYRIRKTLNYGGSMTSEMTVEMVEILSGASLEQMCRTRESFYIYNSRGGLIGWAPCIQE